jgi:hypothetical protein
MNAETVERFTPVTDMPLDQGIARYVIALRSSGVETFESCEGGNGHAFPEPTIRFHGGAGEGFRAFGVAVQLGLPVANVRLSYTVNEHMMLMGPWWEMTFATTATP